MRVTTTRRRTSLFIGRIDRRMGIKLRPAQLADAPALVEIKRHLRMPPEAGQTQQGGFLLGTTQEQYERFIVHDEVWVAEEDSTRQVVGFSIVLSHESILGSQLWHKAAQAQWADSFLRHVSQRRLAYYEQLAFLPSAAYRVYAKYLALTSVQRAFAAHTSLLTTIIRQPIHNRAALPFLHVAGFERVGCIDEIYPEYGPVSSDIYHLDRAVFETNTREGFLGVFIKQACSRGYHLQEN